jgi:geranylgeranyl diphosphate synthase type I
LGYALAKKDGIISKEELQKITNYALPLGTAFQIRDDILGVFGDEKKLGKPVGSDIIEGKQTLLLIKAMKNANKSQLKELKNTIGNKDVTKKQIENFREIIKETGSLDYSVKLSNELVVEAKDALKKANLKNAESIYFLEGIADYIIHREK